MSRTEQDQADRQRKYYEVTASSYDSMHLDAQDKEHEFSLALLSGLVDLLEISSILDVGSGTGRAISYLKERHPDLQVVGLEPVAALREEGYSKGIPIDSLIDGDATNLNFGDRHFDLVCEFGVLHHIARPSIAVAEMLRVSKTAIYISDCNRFGQGSARSRLAKQALGALKLWKAVNLVKTRGKGYTITEGDGLAYSYSVFDNYDQISRSCKSVHIMNTKDGSINPFRTASHVAVLGLK